MLITLDQLRKIMPHAGIRAEVFHPHIEATLAEFEINTPRRIAAFLAQLAHESGEMRHVEEIASGAAYEGRKDLGNTQRGDGVKYKGRGLIQVTGRSNYLQCSNYFGRDFIASPTLMSRPEWAVRTAGWFWFTRHLNSLADLWDFKAITKKVNGGYNGLAQREAYYKTALAVYDEQTPAPVEDRFVQPMEGKPMLSSFISAALPALLNVAPDLIRVFGKGEQSEANAKAAEKVVEIAKVVTSEETAEGAVTKLQADPEMASEFQKQTRAQFLEIEALADKRIEAARAFNSSEPPLWGRIKFVHLLSFVLLIFSGGGGVYVLANDFPPELKGSIITLMLIGGWTQVQAYWLGSSSGSDKKTEMMERDRG